MANKKPLRGPAVDNDSKRVEWGSNPAPLPDDFFKPSEKTDPNFRPYWALNDPRRVHELKRKGYEVDPSVSSEQVAKKVEAQREYLKKAMYDPNVSKENAQVAKDILARMESAPLDTVTNIPHHVLMRIPADKYKEIVQKKLDVSKQMGDKIAADVNDLNKALQRSGKGGIRAFQDLFDSIKD